MSTLINNNKFRRSTLTITKKVNGSLVTTDGFPKVHSLLDAFDTYPAITVQDFEIMTDTDYDLRLDAFYTYLEGLYTFFVKIEVSNVSSGTDAVLCPIESTELDPVVVRYNAYVSVYPDHLSYMVEIEEAAVGDINFTFTADIYKDGLFLRTQEFASFIRSGRTYYDSSDYSEDIFIEEVTEETHYTVQNYSEIDFYL